MTPLTDILNNQAAASMKAVFEDVFADKAKTVPDNYRTKDLEKYAKENGLRVVRPEPYQLLIDIDTTEDFQTFHKQIAILSEKFEGVTWIVRPSRNKPQGNHITVTVPGANFTPLERVAYQAALGSDRVREILSLTEIRDGKPDVSVFFEKL